MTPQHIDQQSLAALPRTAGVYIFKGQGTLPLYIGKSVDIRSRVMSHLRAPDEARMVAQTRSIEFIETAGEIGALLLESRMIKEQSPLFNQRLRRTRSLCAIRLEPLSGTASAGMRVEIVHSKGVQFGATPGLYGLFASAHAAKAMLRQLAQQHSLCLATLGLEKAGARGCFGLQIKTCLGTCVGKEARASHDARLMAALAESQVHVWPFAGPVDLIEQSGAWVQRHRVDNWCHLGTWCSKSKKVSEKNLVEPAYFDLDAYKILVKPIMLGSVKLESVER